MMVGSRWITCYVLSLMVGLQWLLGVLIQVMPESPVVEYSRYFFPPFYAYFTTVWLMAGERALRGRSALSDGCFGASRRNLFYASLPYIALYVPTVVLLVTDPRRIPLWGLICAASILLLPFILLEGQAPSQAVRSARTALQTRPGLVVATLVATALLYTCSRWAVATGYNHMFELVIRAVHGEVSGLSGEILRWPVTVLVAYFCSASLTSLSWMLPGPASLWIYWKCRETRPELPQ